MRRALSNALVVTISILVSLLVAEGVLAWLGYPSEPPMRVAHPPDFTQARESVEFRYRFATNSTGLRYREIPRLKPPDVRRVMVLGDSYTEGLGVEDRDRFTERLEREFASEQRAVEFVNGGLSGSAPHHYARLLKHVGLGYRPDAVLLCVFANDVANTPENPSSIAIDPPARVESRPKALLRTVWPRIYTLLSMSRDRWRLRRDSRTSDYVAEVSARARRRGIDETRIAAWSKSLPGDIVDAINDGRFGFGVLAYGVLYPEFWVDALDLESPRSETKWRNMLTSLDAIAAMTRRDGVELAVVYLPVHFQYDPATHRPNYLAVRTGTLVRGEWLTGVSEVESRLSDWAAQREVAFLSLTETFRDALPSEQPLDYALDGHWTAEGHAVAARAIVRWLREGNVLGAVDIGSR